MSSLYIQHHITLPEKMGVALLLVLGNFGLTSRLLAVNSRVYRPRPGAGGGLTWWGHWERLKQISNSKFQNPRKIQSSRIKDCDGEIQGWTLMVDGKPALSLNHQRGTLIINRLRLFPLTPSSARATAGRPALSPRENRPQTHSAPAARSGDGACVCGGSSQPKRCRAPLATALQMVPGQPLVPGFKATDF